MVGPPAHESSRPLGRAFVAKSRSRSRLETVEEGVADACRRRGSTRTRRRRAGARAAAPATPGRAAAGDARERCVIGPFSPVGVSTHHAVRQRLRYRRRRWGCGARGSDAAATRSRRSASTAAPRSCGSTRSTRTAGSARACCAPVTPTRSRRRGAGTSRTAAHRTPRLWVDRPPVPPPPPLCVVDPVDGRRPTAPRTETEDEEPLPFAVGRTPDEEAQEERKAADDIDEMFVARTPLLVRAFAGSVVERDE